MRLSKKKDIQDITKEKRLENDFQSSSTKEMETIEKVQSYGIEELTFVINRLR